MSRLDIRNLNVNFGKREAVVGLHASVAPGEWLCLIGPNGAGKSSVLRSAAGLVRLGRSVSCANRWQTAQEQPDAHRNPRPAQFEMSVNPGGSSDFVGVWYHGFVTTHIDALCHMFTSEHWRPERRLYNDRPVDLVTMAGALANSVESWRDGIVTRGVLYDIPRMRGTAHVAQGAPVEGWDLADFAAQAAGVHTHHPRHRAGLATGPLDPGRHLHGQ